MIVKKAKLRILFVTLIVVSSILFVFIILNSLKENVVYFLSPTDIKNLSEIKSEKIRVGGMVKESSIIVKQNNISFIITDFKSEINVNFSGTVPNLFSEKKGVVDEGYLEDKNLLKAKKILAKHDENYMPPEVKEALEVK